jgi:hypothetical protein
MGACIGSELSTSRGVVLGSLVASELDKVSIKRDGVLGINLLKNCDAEDLHASAFGSDVSGTFYMDIPVSFSSKGDLDISATCSTVTRIFELTCMRNVKNSQIGACNTCAYLLFLSHWRWTKSEGGERGLKNPYLHHSLIRSSQTCDGQTRIRLRWIICSQHLPVSMYSYGLYNRRIQRGPAIVLIRSRYTVTSLTASTASSSTLPRSYHP